MNKKGLVADFPRSYIYLGMSFRLVSIAVIMLSTAACQMGSRQSNDLYKQAEQALRASPEKVITITDSFTKGAGVGRISKKQGISFLLLRQQAFSKLGMMDSVLAVGIKVRELASVTGDSLAMAKSLLPVRGEINMTDQLAFEPFLSGAVRSFASARMIYEEAVIEALIGGLGSRKGDFSGSMIHLYRARDILEGLDSTRALYSVYMNIGNNRSGMGDQRASIGFYQMASGIARKFKDSLRIATALMNEGIALSDMNIFDSSRMRFNEGLSHLPARNGELASIQLRFNLATLSEKQGMLSAAEADYRRVLEGGNEMGDPVAVGMASAAIAVVMGETGRVGPAIQLLEGTVRKLDSIGFRHYDMEFTTNLVQLYKKAGRYPEALKTSEYLKILSDSMLSADKMKAIEELEARYKFEKHEEEKRDLSLKLRMNRLVAIGFGLAALSLLIIGIVFRQRNRFQHELLKSYERMLVRYRQDRDSTGSGKTPTYWDMSGEKDTDEHDDSPDRDEQSEDSSQGSEPTEDDHKVYGLILDYFAGEKPYLNPRLKVEDVATRLGVPDRRLSQLIKTMSGQSFNNFVNRYRIDEATRMMEDPQNLDWKIDVIADRSGFSSRQQFRRIFEQVTGVNPGYYRSRMNEGKD